MNQELVRLSATARPAATRSFLARGLATAAVGLLGLAGLAACGDGDDPADATTTSADTAATDTAADDQGSDDQSGGDGTSPDSPLAAGSSVEVGDWTVTITDVVLDATDAIMAENEFNEPPADGSQLAMYTIEGTYNGDETGTLWLDVTVGIWVGGVFYGDCENVVPGDVIDAPEVSNGGSASGSNCAEIPSDGLDGALVYVEDWLSFDNSKFFIQI